MRIKEDRTSWRIGALKKREFRHDHRENRFEYRSHKHTKIWCRGKFGNLHKINWQKEALLFDETIYAGTCVKCGKRIFSKNPK